MSRPLPLIALSIAVCAVLPWLVLVMPEGTTSAQPAESPWPMFGRNAQRTGLSPHSGPAQPELKWSFTTGGAVASSPAVAADGTIYVGSADKKLHAQCGFPSMPHAFIKLDGDADKFIRNCYSQYLYLASDSISSEMRLICDYLDMKILED